jgi:hypothetical protein
MSTLIVDNRRDFHRKKRHRFSLTKVAKSKECPLCIDKLLGGRIIDHLLSGAGSFSKSDPSKLWFDYSFAARHLQLALVVNLNGFYRAL